MIVCCGEALIDMLPRASKAGEPAFAPYVGGAVFNTAIALGRLDIPVGFFTGISTDLFGVMLRDTLTASNVDLGYVKFSDLPTTLAFVRLVDGHATYTLLRRKHRRPHALRGRPADHRRRHRSHALSAASA
jgi:fructokinase